jgi:hypothetical protein
MQGLGYVMPFWFHTGRHVIILLNGHGRTSGSFFIYSLASLLMHYRPANPKELYNLRHSSARNVVERVFGVIKHRWTILTRPPHYDMNVQAKIPSALVALHNFILEHDEADLDRWIIDEQAQDNSPGARRNQEIDFGCLASSARVSPAEKRQAETTCDNIANAMWDDYMQYLAEKMDVDSHYSDIRAEPLD